MKHINIANKKGLFTPLIESDRVQAATMVLKPGQSSDDRVRNEHPKSEQWLLVIAGSGQAKVGDRSLRLKAGSLLLIEPGEPHQITNTGTEPMATINFYAPPAYTAGGNVKAAIKE